MKYVITDTCYWLGLVDQTDQHHEKSLKIHNQIKNDLIIFPFPCFYEIIRDRFLKDKHRLTALENLLKNSNVKYIYDTDYKDDAIIKVYELNKRKGDSYSIADIVLREMLSDDTLRIDSFVTYNVKDFYDVCGKRKIEIIHEIL
jgi:hypothetical protein